MFTEVYGYRVNLIYIAIAVALYDLFHVLFELKERFVRFQEYENTDYGCMSDMFQYHCVATYSEVGVYGIDFIFTTFLIYGASSVNYWLIKIIQSIVILKLSYSFQLKTIPVLCWLLLSSYHLADFVLWFTPIYGVPLSFDAVPLIMKLDIGKHNFYQSIDDFMVYLIC